MLDLSTLNYNPTADKLVKILCQKTQSKNELFFHVLVAYYFSKIASMMRVNIKTHDRGEIPVNLYAINLAYSGEGKGHSTNIMEDEVIHLFKARFMEETFDMVSSQNLHKIGVHRALKKNSSEDDEVARTIKEFENLGNFAFSFDSGTTAAVKQMRHKLLMANAGSMNLEIDEIGSNLLGNIDVLTTFLELFDVGKVKQKLTKNTSENVRGEEIDGRTPTNMLLFGTPAKLLNGGKIEEEFYTMLDTGYARRCLFGYAKLSARDTSLTPDQVYNMLTDNTADAFIQSLATQLSDLGQLVYFDTKLTMSKAVSLLLIEYKLMCEKLANSLPEHDEIRKAEITHRYFKALKLAGAYAFIEGSSELTRDHLCHSLALVEASGRAFHGLLTRERNYVKLAKYIASIEKAITHVDLVEDLPFYKGAEAQKRELMNLATAYGYQNNIIIKKNIVDGVEFLSGESLKATDINKMTLSYSTQLAEGYKPDFAKFTDLHKLTCQKNYHWVSHHCLDNYRKEENIIPGFNMIVLDIDGTCKLDTVRILLRDYTYHIYTTKSHTVDSNRFRLVMPLSHSLKLDAIEYKEFMNNIYEWLPFEVDTQTNQRSRKWGSNDGTYHYNEGKLLDALLFIPKTAKNENRKKNITDLYSLTNMERWFVDSIQSGNRSNQLIRYALMLVDTGMSMDNVTQSVLSLNNKLSDKLDEAEIMSTILVSAAKALHKRNSG